MRLAIFGCLLLALGTRAADEVVRLPAYPVRENIVLLPPEPWRYARLGEFEILSNAPDAATEQTAARLWRFQALFHDLFPPVKNLPPLPVALLLCGAQGKFNQLIRDGAAPVAGPNTGRGTFLAADAALLADAARAFPRDQSLTQAAARVKGRAAAR